MDYVFTVIHLAAASGFTELVTGYPVYRGTFTETLPVFPERVCCIFLVLLLRFFLMREKLEQRVIESLRVFELHSVGGGGYLDFTAGRDASV